MELLKTFGTVDEARAARQKGTAEDAWKATGLRPFVMSAVEDVAFTAIMGPIPLSLRQPGDELHLVWHSNS